MGYGSTPEDKSKYSFHDIDNNNDIEQVEQVVFLWKIQLIVVIMEQLHDCGIQGRINTF